MLLASHAESGTKILFIGTIIKFLVCEDSFWSLNFHKEIVAFIGSRGAPGQPWAFGLWALGLGYFGNWALAIGATQHQPGLLVCLSGLDIYRLPGTMQTDKFINLKAK